MRARLRKRQVREALCSCGHAETLHMRLYGKCLAPLGNGSDVERRLSDLCCEVDGGCGRFSGVAPGLSPAEQATVDRFEAAEAAPESAVERVARAMYEADEAWAEESDYDFHEPVEWRYNYPAQEDYRRRASAAVTALSSPTDAGAR